MTTLIRGAITEAADAAGESASTSTGLHPVVEIALLVGLAGAFFLYFHVTRAARERREADARAAAELEAED